MKMHMASNSTTQPSKTESDSQLPNLVDWIKNEFPEKTITYRGKEFIFHADVPIDSMEEIGTSKVEGVAKIKLMMMALSVEPKLTPEVMEVMGSTMLMELYNLLFPKAEPSSQPENINDISSAL